MSVPLPKPLDKKVASFEGRLTIQGDRGTIYFHDKDGECLLRLEGLPVPLPDPYDTQIDVRHMKGVCWQTKDPSKNIFCKVHGAPHEHTDCGRV